jgi:hypothetical protein
VDKWIVHHYSRVTDWRQKDYALLQYRYWAAKKGCNVAGKEPHDGERERERERE